MTGRHFDVLKIELGNRARGKPKLCVRIGSDRIAEDYAFPAERVLAS